MGSVNVRKETGRLVLDFYYPWNPMPRTNDPPG